jgi:hypothetical protein
VTEGQRRTIVGAMGTGLTVSEAADLARVPYAILRNFWAKGEADRTAGRDTEQARFESDALHARAKHDAELKVQANAAAGTKEASDRLAMIRRLAEERLPEAAGNEIVSAPRLLVETSDPAVRELAREAMDASTALLEALAGV